MRKTFKYTSIAVFLASGITAWAAQPTKEQSTDTNKPQVYLNGHIYTGNSKQPFTEAAVVQDGRFTYVGNNKQAQELAKSGQLIDLKGKTVIPGLYDSHIHPIGAGENLLYDCNFPQHSTVDEILTQVAQCVETIPEDSWIIGGRWSPDIWAEKPTAEMLDKVSKGRPVVLNDFSNHNIWANTHAMELAGVSAKSMESFGDLAKKDPATGKLTGFFVENATNPVRSAIPARTPEQFAKAAEVAIKKLNGVGFIGVKDSYVYDKEYQAWKSLDDKGALTARVALSWGWNMKGSRKNFKAMVKPSSGHLYSNFAKITLDGIPPTKTAAMLEPYLPSDENNRGILQLKQKMFIDDLIWLDKNGFTTQVHAVGDRAARLTLDAVEAARKANGDSGLRHEIAHACIVAPEDINRFEQLHVVPNFSPIFWYPSPIQDGLMAVLGKERATRNCAMKSLVNSRPTGGSDWPVSPDMNPWRAMEAMVTRQNPDGERPDEYLWPEERITLEQALAFYTSNGAAAMRLEEQSGSITTGKTADMVILDRDIFDIPASELSETKVLETIFEGKTVFEADDKKVSDTQQTDEERAKQDVMKTVNTYIKNTYTGNADGMKTVFHKQALVAGDLPHTKVYGDTASFLHDLKTIPSMASQKIDYKSNVTYINVQGNVANVTLEESNLFGGSDFVNFLNLVKEDGEWKIAAKFFTYKQS